LITKTDLDTLKA